jgi:hypothetical protein
MPPRRIGVIKTAASCCPAAALTAWKDARIWSAPSTPSRTAPMSVLCISELETPLTAASP